MFYPNCWKVAPHAKLRSVHDRGFADLSSSSAPNGTRPFRTSELNTLRWEVFNGQ
jgi:hypothetical protein